MDRLSHQPHAERGANSAHSVESRGTIGTQSLVESFPSDPRSLGDLRHAAGTSDVSQRRCQQCRVVGLQDVGQIGSNSVSRETLLREARLYFLARRPNDPNGHSSGSGQDSGGIEPLTKL